MQAGGSLIRAHLSSHASLSIFSHLNGSFRPQTRSHAPIWFRLRAVLSDPSGLRKPAYQGNGPGTPTPPSPA